MNVFLSEVTKKNNKYFWYIGSFCSLVLLGFVFYQFDIALFRLILSSISIPFFILAIFILLLEGIFTALRLRLFTPGKPEFKKCLKITAWFIISLILLPARLGELAIILLIRNNLNQSMGAAVMNVLTQRLIDMIFLFSMLFSFILFSKTEVHSNSFLLYLGIFSILSLLFLSIYKLDHLLKYFASITFIYKRNKTIKKILRMILQARTWHRIYLNNIIITKAIFFSACKWSCNIGGITLLLFSLQIPLNNVQLLLSSTAYNFLAIIPIQTIGGFGLSEAGLTSILVFFGLPIEYAANASVFSRLVLITTPFIFFIFISLLYFKRKSK